MRIFFTRAWRLGVVAALAAHFVAPTAWAQNAQMPFGFTNDINFASALWSTLTVMRLVGPEAIRSKPYVGGEPHGAILTTLEATIEVNGQPSTVFVKNNFLGAGATVESVAQNPAAYLDSVTVMVQREAGYDRENQNWFYAKYNPDGSLQRNPQNVTLAGRIGKDSPQGCIPCHRGAPGNDFVYLHNRLGR